MDIVSMSKILFKNFIQDGEVKPHVSWKFIYCSRMWGKKEEIIFTFHTLARLVTNI